MTVTFEVRETDLMGRVGVLRARGKSVETPCLTPVIHPIHREIPLSRFEEMGFGILMTNAYILYKRRLEEALENGLHRYIGFDGLIMTDSGGYQVLEYGDADVSPSQIAEFQARIGSDMAVTLDRPTGYSNSRGYARETMRVSLDAAVETLRSYSGDEDSRKTTWVGPVQGGIFAELVRFSARSLVKAGFSFLALGSPVELMEGYRFHELVRMIVSARSGMPFSMPLHLFGAGHPLTLPLSVALGCDTFDSASYVLYARKGRYITERGTLELGQMTYLPCSCRICNSTTPAELRMMAPQERELNLALHNLYTLRTDVLRCREAIVEGRLWDLVEERASAHPRVMTAFRTVVSDRRLMTVLAKSTPFLKERGLLVRGDADRLRPEIATARRHLEGAMRRRSREAVLIADPTLKPLALVRPRVLQRLSRGKGSPDLYRMHGELGPYPAELEYVYPFTQTTSSAGDVGPRERRQAVARLRQMGYARVRVIHGLDRRRSRRKKRLRPAASGQE